MSNVIAFRPRPAAPKFAATPVSSFEDAPCDYCVLIPDAEFEGCVKCNAAPSKK